MKTVDDIMLNRTIQKFKNLLAGKANINHSFNREKGVGQKDENGNLTGEFKSQTKKPLFFIVTILETTPSTLPDRYYSVPVEWNICTYDTSVLVNYCGGVLRFSKSSKESGGIVTFSIVTSEDITGEESTNHKIVRVDGYY